MARRSLEELDLLEDFLFGTMVTFPEIGERFSRILLRIIYVIVVMILPFDPFGLNRMVYTVQNRCVEEPTMPYDDGAKTLFLYTKGTAGHPPQELRQLLHYMEHTTDRNASNADLREIQEMVQTVKKDREVSLGFMKIFEREEMLINQGRQEESVHTERERRRAEAAEKRASAAEGHAHAAEKRAFEAEEKAHRLQEELRRLKQTL